MSDLNQIQSFQQNQQNGNGRDPFNAETEAFLPESAFENDQFVRSPYPADRNAGQKSAYGKQNVRCQKIKLVKQNLSGDLKARKFSHGQGNECSRNAAESREQNNGFTARHIHSVTQKRDGDFHNRNG